MANQTFTLTCTKCTTKFPARYPKAVVIDATAELAGVMFPLRQFIEHCPKCGQTYCPTLKGFQGTVWQWIELAEDPRRTDQNIIVPAGPIRLN